MNAMLINPAGLTGRHEPVVLLIELWILTKSKGARVYQEGSRAALAAQPIGVNV